MLSPRYERVRETEISFVRSHYAQLGDALSSITDRLVQGELPYAGEVLKTLLHVNEPSISHSATKGQNSSTASVASKPIRPPSYLLPSTRRAQSRGNVAPPLFRSNYHTLFSQQHQGAANVGAAPMTTSTSGGAGSSTSHSASATPVWYSFTATGDDEDDI